MDFYRRVILVCRAVPLGYVATYGQIARLIGRDRNMGHCGNFLSHVRGRSGSRALLSAFRRCNRRHRGRR